MKPISGIAVDGSTRGNPGLSEYRGVDLSTGEVIFHQKIGISTNNITEFIALCHAILLNLDKKTTIYTDSQTSLYWLKSKSVTTKLPKNEKTKIANEYLQRCLSKLKDLNVKSDGIDLFVNNITVSKWYTSEWGEIPADFNNK
jgi:ribonuclease HI